MVAEEQIIELIQPDDLADFLYATGWAEERRVGNKSIVYRKEGTGDLISVPASRSFVDYGRRLYELVDDIASVEQSDRRLVAQRIVHSWADVIRFRVNTSLMEHGTIPVAAGVNAFEDIKSLLVSAARSALQPRNAYASRPPSEASAYLRTARFGPTEPGSYVITVFSPVSPSPDERKHEREPFARQVTSTLATGLAATKDAALRSIETNSLVPFAEAVSRGVSANLLEAISALGKISFDNAVELRFTWSFRKPPSAEAAQELVVPHKAISVLGVASEYLKELEPEPNFEFSGFIYRIEDVKNEAHDLRATAVGVVEERERAVEFSVPSEDRDAALRALKEHLPVYCKGTLDRRSRPYKLTDFKRIRVASLFTPPQ